MLVMLQYCVQILRNTPSLEKKESAPIAVFRHNLIKYWPIFKILSLSESAGNLQ